MNNIEHMLKVVNQKAMFAQLNIVTTGTCYDEGVELFRRKSNGEKTGKCIAILDLDDLFAIAKDLMKERKLHHLSEKECGEFQGFEVRVIYNGGAGTHFEITKDGQVSREYSEWCGHGIPEDLD